MNNKHAKQTTTYLPSTQVIVKYVVIFGIIIFVLYHFSAEIRQTSALFSQARIEAFIKSAGVFSWLVYLALVVVAVLGPITSSTIALIGGYLFHPLVAIFLNILGEFIGGTGNFFIGKKLGKQYLMAKFPKVRRIVEKYGGYLKPFHIFLLGLVPVGTSNFTGYVAGMSGVPFRVYIRSWMIAIFFVNVLVTLLGYSAKIHSIPLTIGILVVLALVLLVMKYMSSRKNTL
ncbi:VTT domain-containing protein [Patescibacteria group bacterium]|nr:VTT domain-containing protein [Patescibacteria group bacterium]